MVKVAKCLNCKSCKYIETIPDELGCLYEICCLKCGGHYGGIIEPTGALSESTKEQIIKIWNNANEKI